MLKSKELYYQAKAQGEVARDLMERAISENRELEDHERVAYALALKSCKDQKRQGDEAKAAEDRDNAGMAMLQEISDFVGGSTKAGGYQPTMWAGAVIAKMQHTASGMGLKNLLSGQISTPPVVEVAALPDVPHRLLDLIPREALTANTFAFLQQTLKTQNAAVVADAGTKPSSIFTFAEVPDRCRVIAHLSEPFPIRYLSDHAELARILNEQMAAGVMAALESEVVQGSGQGEHFDGLLTIAGTTPVPFATDVITTLRSARTALEIIGEVPSGWLFNPLDAAVLDLIREMNLSDEGGFLVNTASAATIFGPYPRISSLAVPQGTAVLADWTQAAVMIREGVSTLAATQANVGGVDLWSTNQVVLRSEGRFGLKVRRPQAFAVVDLGTGS